MGRASVPGVRALVTGVIVVAALALGGCSDDEPAAEGETTAESVERPELGACGPEVRPRHFRCGSLEVPLEREDPSMGTIDVRFAVREHRDPDAPPALPIFAVEGGPGYGSMEAPAPT